MVILALLWQWYYRNIDTLERNMAVRLRRQKIYGLVLVSGLTVLSVYFYLISVDQNCKRPECRKRYV